jgi:hypothetical protein
MAHLKHQWNCRSRPDELELQLRQQLRVGEQVDGRERTADDAGVGFSPG